MPHTVSIIYRKINIVIACRSAGGVKRPRVFFNNAQGFIVPSPVQRGGKGALPLIALKSSIVSTSRGTFLMTSACVSGIMGLGSSLVSFLNSLWNSGS